LDTLLEFSSLSVSGVLPGRKNAKEAGDGGQVRDGAEEGI